MEKNFEFLEHTADIKFRAYGETIEKAFENSAYALKNIITKEPVKEKIVKKVKVENVKDIRSLLYHFLEEFLYLLDSENFILSRIKNLKINLNLKELEAVVIGDDIKNYNTEEEIKAITYNDMIIEKDKKGFLIQVVVDV